MAARSRSSDVRRDKIEYSFWLIFAADGSMRFTRLPPTVKRDERAMSLSAVLPSSLFKTPVLQAKIAVGADHTAQSIDIEAAGAALRNALGVDIDLRVNESPADEG